MITLRINIKPMYTNDYKFVVYTNIPIKDKMKLPIKNVLNLLVANLK